MDVDEGRRWLVAWWGGVPRPRKIMLGAIGLLFGSQFLTYGDVRRYMLTDATNLRRYTGMTSYTELADGWAIHPQAMPILVVLALGFGTPYVDRPKVARWAYWVGVALVFLAVVPAAPTRAIGGALGLAAFGIAIWAARAARKANAV